MLAPAGRDATPAAVVGPDKENELRPSGTPGGAALRAKQLGHPKRPVSSILTPLGKRAEASTGTPGKGLLRDITNSAHVKRVGEHPLKEQSSGERTAPDQTEATPTAPRDFASIEELLALPDDQLPDIELVARPPTTNTIDQDEFGELPELSAMMPSDGEDNLDEAESIILLELDDTWDAEIARVLKDIRVDPADFVWAARGNVGDEETVDESLPPCCMFDDIPASATVNTNTSRNKGEN